MLKYLVAAEDLATFTSKAPVAFVTIKYAWRVPMVRTDAPVEKVTTPVSSYHVSPAVSEENQLKNEVAFVGFVPVMSVN